MAHCRRCRNTSRSHRPRGLVALLSLLLGCGLASPRPVGAQLSQSGDAKAAIALAGFVQADAYLYRQDSQDQLDGATGQPLNETRFLIRRARLRAQAEAPARAWLLIGGLLEVDGSTVQGSQVRLLGGEAWAKWQGTGQDLPYIQATLGLFKIPFGREVQEFDPDRLFLERSRVVQALFPGEYDLGLRLHGAWRFLRYGLAIMNGAPAGEAQFALRDPNRSKDVLLRIGVAVQPVIWAGLRVGVSGLYGTGFSPGSPASKDSLTWRDDNEDGQVQLSELLPLRGRAAVPSQDFSRDALGFDVQLTLRFPLVGALYVTSELLLSRNLDRGLLPADPIAAARDLRELGYYLALSGQLTPYGLWGLRFDSYDPDADSQQQSGIQRLPVSVAFSTLTATCALLHPRFGRLSLEYQHNRNGLGRSPSGLPMTLGRDALLFRAQAVF